jgi:hypothetical protein
MSLFVLLRLPISILLLLGFAVSNVWAATCIIKTPATEMH